MIFRSCRQTAITITQVLARIWSTSMVFLTTAAVTKKVRKVMRRSARA